MAKIKSSNKGNKKNGSKGNKASAKTAEPPVTEQDAVAVTDPVDGVTEQTCGDVSEANNDQTTNETNEITMNDVQTETTGDQIITSEITSEITSGETAPADATEITEPEALAALAQDVATVAAPTKKVRTPKAPRAPKAPKAEKVVVAKAPKAPKAPKSPKAEKVVRTYPFRSKKDILGQVASDDAFMIACLGVLHSAQTTAERDKKVTMNKNAEGFMCSHASVGTTLAVKAADGGLDADETAKAREIVSHYGRQLARHFRDEVLASDPALRETAALFGVA